MKLVRYGSEGRERPGIIDPQGRLRSLQGVVTDIGPQVYSAAGQRALRELDLQALPLVKGKPRLGVPFVGIGKFVAIGLNYHDHARETGTKVPSEPIVFNKWTTCLSGPCDPIEQPPHSTRLDWEVELGVVIGRAARYVGVGEALKYVAGYCTLNDVSERQFQIGRGSQWDKGKGCDGFGPVGPWLVTADEVGDPQNLALRLSVNGQLMQDGNTRDMIFTVGDLLSRISQTLTLNPGDVLATGTPEGVGYVRPPPWYLQPGDVVEVEVERLGSIRTPVVGSSERP